MTKLTRCGLWLAALSLLSPVAPIAAQDGPALPEQYRESIPLLPTALGPYSFAISSSNEEAQQFFDQGMQLMFAFAKVDAVRSFRESWTRDPDCAICYWGEAWAWGSYLNGPMRPPAAPHAYVAVQKALELAERHASARERAYIEALSVRREQDEAYVALYGRRLCFCWNRDAGPVISMTPTCSGYIASSRVCWRETSSTRAPVWQSLFSG